MVNTIAVAKMPGEHLVVMEMGWDNLGELGGANYDWEYLEKFFGDRSKGWLISAVFYSDISSFDRQVPNWNPKAIPGTNSGFVAELTRGFMESGMGNKPEELRTASNRPGDMIIPIGFGSGSWTRIRP